MSPLSGEVPTGSSQLDRKVVRARLQHLERADWSRAKHETFTRVYRTAALEIGDPDGDPALVESSASSCR
jgi:hypothetical protein